MEQTRTTTTHRPESKTENSCHGCLKVSNRCERRTTLAHIPGRCHLHGPIFRVVGTGMGQHSRPFSPAWAHIPGRCHLHGPIFQAVVTCMGPHSRTLSPARAHIPGRCHLHGPTFRAVVSEARLEVSEL